ncbi:MAG: aminopeptidase P family protein [Candidatus Omnitrophica bacterium]|nr:aminopeptidase P family protein [Candidatus Omnitrophota bacterium]MDD5352303.1 aminopeptidase P family protein [Candidatus Omnitrophota bacterium]MDD5549901.1 aminopeptidase P family protein [Candidatus Omnitrophota bacterium]
MTRRIARLRNILRRKGMDAIILSHPANVSYLTGFPTQDSSLFINEKNSILITDFRYSSEYRNLLKNSETKILEINKPLIQTIRDLNKKLRIKNLAFEEEHISFSYYQKLKSVSAKKLIPVRKIVEDMRIIKDSQELKLIKKSTSITLETLKYVGKILRPGMKEIELAAEIERYIRLKGTTGTAFEIIVASGPHSSFPHAKKTQRIIAQNEPVLIDLGVDCEGYKSDLTRVFFLGKMDTLFRKIYGIVQAAQKKAISVIRPGIPINKIDKEAREFIAKKGFAKYFKHSLGHGIGLEIHELPRIYQKNKDILKQGMVFTVEPGIYLPDKFGVRVEDMICVTHNGAEVLSDS